MRPVVTVIGILLIIALTGFWLFAAGAILFGYPIASFILPSAPFLTSLGIINILLVIALPLLSVVFLILRVLYGYRVSKKWHTGLWIVGTLNLVSLFGLGSYISNQFKVEKVVEQSFQTAPVTTDTLKIELGDNIASDFSFFNDNPRIVDGNLIYENVYINIEKATGSAFEFEEERSARGEGSAEALNLAKEFGFVHSLSNNTLVLNPYVTIPDGSKWRNQRMTLTIKIPEGKSIQLGDYVNSHVRNVDFNENADRPWMASGQVWTMTANGLEIPGYLDENKTSLEKNFTDFQQLSIKGEMKVQIEQGDNYEVVLKGPKQGKEGVEFQKLDKTLIVENTGYRMGTPLRLYITCPDLEWIELENTDDVKISGFESEKLKMDVDSRFELKTYNLKVKDLSVHLKDRVKADFKGSAENFELELEDNSKFNSEFFTVKNAIINAKGNNLPIRLTVTETLQPLGNEIDRWDISGEPALPKEEQ
ncbi:MAG: DUF2807 domain-containing protein [Saprospiraceae bacterium]|nr:DUF2807 domain-containing protein [Saprospiraceae bacterium]